MPKGEGLDMSNVNINSLADEVVKCLNEYKDGVNSQLKKAVCKAGNTVKKNIFQNAPKRTGAYAKSWSVKKIKETKNSLSVTVHSKNRYQIAHLLEFGHAKRNGGRVEARPHIAKAEEKGIAQLESEIERSLKNE